MAGEGIAITQRAAEVTIAHWEKKISDQAKQRFVVLDALTRRGRIKRVTGGGQIRWPVMYDYHELRAHVDGKEQVYDRFNGLDNAVLPWAGYELTDIATFEEKEQNGGEAAIVKILNDRAPHMMKSALQRFGRKFYVDGPASSQKREFHGLESMMSINAVAQVATDEFATTPNDTYAGIGTSRTSLNSAAVAGDPSYGAWTPVVVNCNRTSGGSTLNWDQYADEYIRAMLIEACYGDGEEDMIDFVPLRKSSFKSLLNILDDKERVNLVRGDQVRVGYGFKPTRFLDFDGAGVTWDFGVPATDGAGDVVHGYGLNLDAMSLKLLDSEPKKNRIFRLRKGFDPTREADLFRLVCLGNFCFESPRHFGKLAEIS